MKNECYLLDADEKKEIFNFFSEGPKGIIKKTIQYEMLATNVYNLGFGDWDEIKHRINDKARTNNGDRDKILTTVARSVAHFIEYHPGALILAVGESPAKTRLYQIGINRNWAEISTQYIVQGFRKGVWAAFEPG
jgi:hypothetical protein